ncbi:Aste57867_15576 [Aphanomyces stellatus]|uniref:Aste57867_15576 protein n=1 Tax=Aphanomyces stellatus TaxID=120398 RepID=A0A485L3F7_9STRA|nr:hypothetical protein As57867_015520 [Aphanomyces stellatus]VFT92378.1 Aste57867_15576 [Aphanomyces stellatus]
MALEHAHKFTAAVAAFCTIERTHPKAETPDRHFNLILKRAYCNSNLKEHALAIKDLTTAIGMKSTPTLYYLRGQNHLGAGNLTAAIDDMNQSLAFEREDARRAACYDARGRAYKNMHEFDLALDDLNAAITLTPRPVEDDHIDSNVYLVRSEIHRALGNFDRALQDMDIFIELDGTAVDREALVSRAKLCMEYANHVDDEENPIDALSKDLSPAAASVFTVPTDTFNPHYGRYLCGPFRSASAIALARRAHRDFMCAAELFTPEYDSMDMHRIRRQQLDHGWCLFGLGRFDEALKILDVEVGEYLDYDEDMLAYVCELRIDNGDDIDEEEFLVLALLCRARIYLRWSTEEGGVDEAIDDLERILEYNQDHDEASHELRLAKKKKLKKKKKAKKKPNKADQRIADNPSLVGALVVPTPQERSSDEQLLMLGTERST